MARSSIATPARVGPGRASERFSNTGGGPHPLVLVVLEHADAVLDDEEQVDARQGGQALPHPVEVLHQAGGEVRGGAVVAVVVLALGLHGREALPLCTAEPSPLLQNNLQNKVRL